MFLIQLSEVEVNTVLLALGELPFKAVGDLVPKIRGQAIAQQQEAAAAEAEAQRQAIINEALQREDETNHELLARAQAAEAEFRKHLGGAT